jgi:hypothetical protein
MLALSPAECKAGPAKPNVRVTQKFALRPAVTASDPHFRVTPNLGYAGHRPWGMPGAKVNGK